MAAMVSVALVGAPGSSWKERQATSTSSACVELGEGVLDAALADVAPRADDVGPDLDLHAGTTAVDPRCSEACVTRRGCHVSAHGGPGRRGADRAVERRGVGAGGSAETKPTPRACGGHAAARPPGGRLRGGDRRAALRWPLGRTHTSGRPLESTADDAGDASRPAAVASWTRRDKERVSAAEAEAPAMEARGARGRGGRARPDVGPDGPVEDGVVTDGLRRALTARRLRASTGRAR